jgi:chromosome segregation ATPase
MTQTTETTNPVETAQNRIEAIRAALADGDQKIKASDLAAARNELEFVELREQAAEIAAEKAAKAERKAHLLDLQKRLEVVAGSRKVVNSKFAEFEKSLANYLTAATTYQNNLDSIRVALREAGMHPGETLGLVGGVAPGQTFFGIQITDIRRKLEIGEVSAENILPNDVVKPIVESALGEYNRNF